MVKPLLATLPLASLLLAAPAAAQKLKVDVDQTWVGDNDYRVGGLAVGDGNDDGLPDLAIACYSGGVPALPLQARMFLGQGDMLETTASWVGSDEYHSTDAGWVVTDGGLPRLIVVSGGMMHNPTVVHEQTADGLQSDPLWSPPADKVGAGADWATGDISGDGVPDLIIAQRCLLSGACPGAPSFAYYSKNGAWTQAQKWETEEFVQTTGVAVGDLDCSHIEDRVATFTGDGARRLLWLPDTPIAQVMRILVDGQTPGKVLVDYKTGLLSFASPPAGEVEVLYQVTTQLDVVTSSRNGGVLFYQGSESGPATAADPVFDTEIQHNGVELADFDLDGYPEVFVSGRLASARIYENDGGVVGGDTLWVSDETYTVEDQVITDLNGDGYPDIAIATFGGIISLFLNNEGTVETTPSLTIPRFGSASGITAGDLTGDGMPEIIIGYSGDPPGVHQNLGSAAAAPEIDTSSIEVGDDGVITFSVANLAPPVRVYVGDIELTVTETSPSVRATTDGTFETGAHDLIVVNRDLQAAVAASAIVVEDGEVMTNPDPTGDGDGGCGCAAGDPSSGGLVLLALLLLGCRRRRRA